MLPRALDALREIAVVARDDLLASLRSFVGVGALLLYLAMNLAAGALYFRLASLLQDKLSDASVGERLALGAASQALWAPLYEWLTGDAEAATAMLEVPVQAVFVFMCAAFFAPVVCILIAHDQIATDLGNGHIRFLAVRCRRVSLLLGRMLSRTLLMATVVLLVAAGDFALMAGQGGGLPPGAWVHFLRYALLLVALVPCWIAVAGVASSLVRSTPAALILGLLALFGLTLLGISRLGFLSPTFFKHLLYSPATWPQGVLAYLGFAAVFTALAWLRLRTRDL